jgi:hypothetical protein
VALALLSHLVTALFVHVPMAYASMTAVAEPAVSPPCPEHTKMHHGPDAAQAGDEARSSMSASSTSTPDSESGCKSGPCKCPCAHAQALAFIPMLAPALVAHSPSVNSYRELLAPDCATSFFRPPI